MKSGLLGLGMSVLAAASIPNSSHGRIPFAPPTQGQTVEIPSQPLRTALDAFARVAGINVTYDPGLIAQKTSTSTRMDIDARSALQRLLEGTGLEPVYTNAQSVTIISSTQRAQMSAPALAAASGADMVLSPMVVDVPRRIGLDPRAKAYAELMRREVQVALATHRDLREGRFHQDIVVTVGADGAVRDAQTSNTFGADEGSERETVRAVIASVRFSAPPPPGMPQPVRLRVRGQDRR